MRFEKFAWESLGCGWVGQWYDCANRACGIESQRRSESERERGEETFGPSPILRSNNCQIGRGAYSPFYWRRCEKKKEKEIIIKKKPHTTHAVADVAPSIWKPHPWPIWSKLTFWELQIWEVGSINNFRGLPLQYQMTYTFHLCAYEKCMCISDMHMHTVMEWNAIKRKGRHVDPKVEMQVWMDGAVRNEVKG